uniref:probable serine/threonine-protein kinase PBL17 n=1 Tax=Erigeron canadensis TaxID=72917 RepID=UPI001CB8DB29|nr:probable serine/threonine-protein kinase PBL17 [Erigeron canadensis]
MTSFMKEFQHLRIRLEEIKKATNNFGNKVIGAGGFGAVYVGEVFNSMGQSIVAIKRLNHQFGQGDPEFLKEIHVAFPYLGDPDLTWTQRIKICLEAAMGLSFLHDPRGTHQRVLHCDIKSANILLDENMNAKVADFGLSKMGPANQQYFVLVTNALGTAGYCDPQFMKTYTDGTREKKTGRES